MAQNSPLPHVADQDSTSETRVPNLHTGYCILLSSVFFLLLGSYATFFSAFATPHGIMILDGLARDTHYKYFAVLLVPTGAYFVIANWVGWQYYRNSAIFILISVIDVLVCVFKKHSALLRIPVLMVQH
ncbi:hypothetical protein B0H21DRAFT_705610 [Amylocystis lapponica]|nr:hypothetical protein B0H21DRAFT_705610 [Amylocystis lapponica]